MRSKGSRGWLVGASVYEGGATRRWLKVKQKGWTVEEDRWRRRIFGEDRIGR